MPHRRLRFWLRPSLIPLIWLLSACQGTEWGERVERFVQPGGLPTPPSATQPEPERISPASPEPGLDSRPAPTPVVQSPTPTAGEVGSRFTDLEPGSLVARSVEALDRLGVFADISGSEFQPQRSVRRGEFARWLVLANNALHADEPSQQIRLGSPSERPLFLDVPEEDPHFRYIQALGAAGLVEGDANREFRPNSLLSRAELIRMKVPLDLPPGRIRGSLAELEEGWGFTDAAEIPPEAVAPLVLDRRLGSASNVLRTFGPIRTFKPFEPVSRGEAAIALSAFGERTAQAAIPQAPPEPGSPEPEPSPPVVEPEPSLEQERDPSPGAEPPENGSGLPTPSEVAPAEGELITPQGPQP